LNEPLAFGPYRFALNNEETRVAIARLSLRYGLSRRFERDYVAPLVLFVLLLVFVAILAFTGLIARRSAEAALLLGAILFLASRFVAHWRLRRGQRLAKSVVDRIAAAGETTLTVDESGLAFCNHATRATRSVVFRSLTDIEDAGGLLYIWCSSADSPPLVVPTRIFADSAEVQRFLAFLRGRVGKRDSAHIP
jgi:hypothetical protein